MTTSDLLNKAKQDPGVIERLLSPPGVLISEIDVRDLKIDVMPSGFPILDEYMLLKRGRSELVIIGGRPSHGKSAFMFQLAYNVAHYAPVHIFSLEMGKEQILTRLISGKINRPISAIQRGLVNEQDLQKAKETIKDLKCFIDDEAGLNIAQISERAHSWHKKAGTKLIVIDYLQIISTEKGHSRAGEIGQITKDLKRLAKELRVPIVVGAQLNRENERRGASSGDYKPITSDLRESGDIENDADVIMLVHRDSRYTGDRMDEADLLIVKNRDGALGEIVMKFSTAQTLFQDVGDTGI